MLSAPDFSVAGIGFSEGADDGAAGLLTAGFRMAVQPVLDGVLLLVRGHSLRNAGAPAVDGRVLQKGLTKKG